jgi:YfiH family protein
MADWIVPDWPAAAQVRSLITTRRGGTSEGPYSSFNLGTHVGDDANAVAKNRQRLRSELPAEPLWLDQVHGTRVIEAEEGAPAPKADAAIAHSGGKVLAVMSADCLPVLLCDRGGTVVGIAHAGWRGLAAGVIENAVHAMEREPKSLLAFLGPAIGPSAYEVGKDVRDAFVRNDADAACAFIDRPNGKFLADLYALARQRLAKAGIMAVFGGTYCTYHEPDRFFSYRRDGATGRMASLIWLAGT